MRPDYPSFSSAYEKVIHILTGESRSFPEERFNEIVNSQEQLRAFQREFGSSITAREEFLYVMDKLALTIQNIALPLVPEFQKTPLHEFASDKKQKAQRELPSSYWFGEKIGPKIQEALKILESHFKFHIIEKYNDDDKRSIPYGLATLIAFERDLRRLGGPIREFDVSDRVHFSEMNGFFGKLSLYRNRNELPLVKANPSNLKLPIGSLNLSERCFGLCPSCSIGALPSDGQMDWALFQALLVSPQLIFKPHVHLGDGEALIYQDKAEGKNLADAIREILFTRAVDVQFTTAGLIPQNRRAGRQVFEALDSLGVYASGVRIIVSFNFFFKGIGDVDNYVKSMEETFERLSRLPCQKAVIVMYNEQNEAETKHRFESLRLKYDLDCDIGGAPMRYVGRSGRELKKMPASTVDFGQCELSSILSNAIRRDVDLSDIISSEDFSLLQQCLCVNRDWGEIPAFAVRSDGRLIINCPCPGTRGTSMGHVEHNDAQQVIALERAFREELRERILADPDRSKRFCKEHHIWNRNFRAPKSDNPIVRPMQTKAVTIS